MEIEPKGLGHFQNTARDQGKDISSVRSSLEACVCLCANLSGCIHELFLVLHGAVGCIISLLQAD